jgi:hypothetical protein
MRPRRKKEKPPSAATEQGQGVSDQTVKKDLLLCKVSRTFRKKASRDLSTGAIQSDGQLRLGIGVSQ